VLTLGEIFGPSHAYGPRAHPATCQWVSDDGYLLDALTCNQLCIAGDMPVVCSAGGTSALAIDLMHEAGLASADCMRLFRGEQEAIDCALDLARNGQRLVVQHAYPTGVLPAGALWVDASLLAYLNNKANLHELVPDNQRPCRATRSYAEVFADGGGPALPIVLKVATDLSTGAGAAVAVCRDPRDVAAAAERFVGCADQLVVEEYLPIKRNPCLHFAVMPDGAVRYLGFADQDVTDAGRYCGNWIDVGSVLARPVVDMAMAVVKRAAALGYRGVVGIDMAMLDDGQTRVLDLNFRINGSTAAVLLAPSIQNQLGPGLIHLRSFANADPIEQSLAVVREAIRADRLIPLAIFDADAAGYPDRPARLSAMILGKTKAHILETERELATHGWA